MKLHSNEFKTQIKELGRELDSIITYSLNEGTIILTNEDLNSVTPHYNGDILKSVMKQLDIDSKIDIPLGTIINYKFGLKVNGEYEYLNFGNYIVKTSEKSEDNKSYKIKCYDKMLYSMKEYEDLEIEYPISIRGYIEKLCEYFKLSFKNSTETFVNYDKMIDKELYLSIEEDAAGNKAVTSLGYTFRDVLDELAEVTASTICINNDDELEIRYINDTEDSIDEEYFSDTNVNFETKYGPVNSIVLSRSAESDNIFLKNEESIAANGLCEIKIKDNQILNWNNRDTFLPEILEKLNGLEFYINDCTTKGICYFDLCDKFNVEINSKIYSCLMLNDEVIIENGLEELFFTEALEMTETDYSKADTTDKRKIETYIIADKMQKMIEAIIKDVEGNAEQIAQFYMNLQNIIMSVQNSGGNNLVKNSVGFAGTSEWELAYDNEETSNIETLANVSLLEHGVSGGAFRLNGVKIKQEIIVNTKVNYSFSCIVSKKPSSNSYIKLYNPNNIQESWNFTFDFLESIDFKKYEIKGEINVSSNKLVLEYYGDENSDLTITDTVITRGDLNCLWTQANGEILNTQVNINLDGVLVKSLKFEETGQYTIISPQEFAGYANKNGVSTRVFTLNGDTTEVEKLRALSMIAMYPLKMIPITSGNNQGVAFVPDEGGN